MYKMLRKLYMTVLSCIILFSFLYASPLVPTGCVWEINGDASDWGAGGFCSALSLNGQSIDYSTSINSIVSVNDAMITTNERTLFSPTAVFTNAMVGNIIFLTGNAAVVSQGYYVITECVSEKVIGLSSCPAITTGDTITCKIGGAISKVRSGLILWSRVPAQTFWVKKSTINADWQTTSGITSSNYADGGFAVIGYYSTRGDNPTGDKRPTINATAGYINCGFGGYIANLVVTGNQAYCFYQSSSSGTWRSIFVNCSAYNTNTNGNGFRGVANAHAIGCDAYMTRTGTSAGFYAIQAIDCYSTGAVYGYDVQGGGAPLYSMAEDNSYGIYCNGTNIARALFNTIYNCDYGMSYLNDKSFVVGNVIVSCSVGASSNVTTVGNATEYSNMLHSNYFMNCITNNVGFYDNGTNISADLGFVDVANGDLRLTANSILLNALPTIANIGNKSWRFSKNAGAIQNAYGSSTVIQQVTTVNVQRIGTHAYTFGNGR